MWLILSQSHATAHKYPSSLYTLAHHIQQPKLPLLTRWFLHFQLQNNVNPSNNNVALPDLSGLPFSVFHSATSTFYAPSDLSGLGGMHSECIQSTPSWQKGPAHYDTVFLEKDPEIPGMGGLHVSRVFLFFSFTYNGIKYPCMLIQRYTTFLDWPDEDMRMWIVQPNFDADGEHELEVIVEVACAPSAIRRQSAHKYVVPSITCSVDLVIVLFRVGNTCHRSCDLVTCHALCCI